MFLTRSLYAIGISALLVFLAGCNTQNSGKKGAAATPQPQSQSHSLDLSLASLYSGVVSKSTASKTLMAVDSILEGELEAYNYSTGQTSNFSWSATLDETALSVTSTKTVTLEPGSYRFSMLLSNEGYQYAGESFATVVDGNATDIPMTLSPIIGDTVVDVSVISTLADYHFSYDATELASLTLPKLGITVDGGVEQIFTINKSTGLTNSYINLSEGSHTIELALYDSSEKVGRSIEAQESVTIVYGSPLTMDIVPLHAETAFVFNTTDGNATITTVIPSDIIGITGESNLQTLFTITDGGTSYEQNMTIYTENNTTYGTITLDPLNYGNYAMQLVFSDVTDPFNPIGSCLMDNVLLDKNGATVQCSVTVATPSLAGGSILASVGINVYDTVSLPISGALVYANNELIGITGSGTFGTEGFLAVDLPAGDVLLRAETNSSYGEINTTLNPLDVANFDLIVGDSSTADTLDLFGDSSAVALYTLDTDRNDLGGVYDTNYSGTSLTSAKINNGVTYLDSADYVQLTTPLPALPEYSVSLFTDATGAASGESWTYGQLVSFAENNGIYLHIYEDRFVLEHNQSDWSSVSLSSPSTISSLGNGFHHIVVTADGTTLRMYIDGALEVSTAYDGTALAKGTGDLIGNRRYYSTQPTLYNAPNGTIDQLRIFNRAVTQDEITQLLNEH